MAVGLFDVMMREIAHKSHVPLAEVRQSFDHELHELAADARVKDFLPLLAMKHVRRDYLHRQQHPGSWQETARVDAKSQPHYKPVASARQLPVPVN